MVPQEVEISAARETAQATPSLPPPIPRHEPSTVHCEIAHAVLLALHDANAQVQVPTEIAPVEDGVGVFSMKPWTSCRGSTKEEMLVNRAGHEPRPKNEKDRLEASFFPFSHALILFPYTPFFFFFFFFLFDSFLHPSSSTCSPLIITVSFPSIHLTSGIDCTCVLSFTARPT
jgi:hypothetical protein